MSEHLFDELKRYVGFGPDDEARLRALHDVLAPHFKTIIANDFYARILSHPGASSAITGGEAQVERLKGTLVAWLKGLFTGPWDHNYYEQRARIGRVHVKINLPQQYMFTAMDVIRVRLTELVISARGLEDARPDLGAINKLMDMELAIMLHTYREDYLLQVQRNERLATFGQLVASIGHELRNPLSVMESSVYLLRNRLLTDERSLKHLDKIDGQLRLSNRIITDLLDIVRERPPDRKAISVRTSVESAVEAVSKPPAVAINVDVDAALSPVLADPGQVRQILVNLLTNAVEAVAPSGEVRVRAQNQGSDVVIVVNDNGTGIDASVRERLFEPLVTTKVRGVGLGLALCRKLAERNGGGIRVIEGELPGAAFELRLPVAEEPHGSQDPDRR